MSLIDETVMPQVTVEFFGIPRARAGRAVIVVDAATLEDLFAKLREEVPEFASACMTGVGLKPEYIVAIDGRRFTSDPAYRLSEGESVQILSADMGG